MNDDVCDVMGGVDAVSDALGWVGGDGGVTGWGGVSIMGEIMDEKRAACHNMYCLLGDGRAHEDLCGDTRRPTCSLTSPPAPAPTRGALSTAIHRSWPVG